MYVNTYSICVPTFRIRQICIPLWNKSIGLIKKAILKDISIHLERDLHKIFALWACFFDLHRMNLSRWNFSWKGMLPKDPQTQKKICSYHAGNSANWATSSIRHPGLLFQSDCNNLPWMVLDGSWVWRSLGNILSQKKFDLERSSYVGKINKAQNAIWKNHFYEGLFWKKITLSVIL